MLPVTSWKILIGNPHADVRALQTDKSPNRQHKCNVQAPNTKFTESLAYQTLCIPHQRTQSMIEIPEYWKINKHKNNIRFGLYDKDSHQFLISNSTSIINYDSMLVPSHKASVNAWTLKDEPGTVRETYLEELLRIQ